MEFAGVVDADGSPVEYSRTLPASILMVVEKSRYPSFVIFRVWVPADNPEIIAGVIPFTSLSTETSAPAGVEVTDNDPVDPELVGCACTCWRVAGVFAGKVLVGEAGVWLTPCWVVTGAFVGILSVWVAGVGLTVAGEVGADKGTSVSETTVVWPFWIVIAPR